MIRLNKKIFFTVHGFIHGIKLRMRHGCRILNFMAPDPTPNIYYRDDISEDV